MEAANKTLPIVQITDNGGKTNQQALRGEKRLLTPCRAKVSRREKWFGSSKGCTATPPTALEPQPRH